MAGGFAADLWIIRLAASVPDRSAPQAGARLCTKRPERSASRFKGTARQGGAAEFLGIVVWALPG